MQVSPSGGQPPSSVDVAVERREPFLAIPVDVLGKRIAGLLDGFEERSEEWARRGATLQDEWAGVSAVRVIGRQAWQALANRAAISGGSWLTRAMPCWLPLSTFTSSIAGPSRRRNDGISAARRSAGTRSAQR